MGYYGTYARFLPGVSPAGAAHLITALPEMGIHFKIYLDGAAVASLAEAAPVLL